MIYVYQRIPFSIVFECFLRQEKFPENLSKVKVSFESLIPLEKNDLFRSRSEWWHRFESPEEFEATLIKSVTSFSIDEAQEFQSRF